MAVIDSLLVELGFEYDPDELKQFNKDLDKTVNLIKKLALVAVAGATALTGMAVASTAASDEQGKLAKEVGDTVENIDALEFAAKRAGDSAEGMGNSLRQLSIRASESARGTGSGVEAFGLLGISVTDVNGRLKSASNLMLEVSGAMQGLSKAKQIELADKLGLRESIRLLQAGPSAIRELTNEAKLLGVTTAEDAAIAEEFQDALVDLWQILKQVSRTLTRVVAPILKGIITLFTDWWKMTRDIMEQNFPNFLEQFISALKLLVITVGVFLSFRLAQHLFALVSLLRGATLATLAFNAAIFILPAMIGLAAAAFVGLVQDAKVFFEGGESFIGDMIEKYPEWAEEIKVVASVLATVYDLTVMIFDGWSKIFDLFNNFSVDNLKEVLGNIPGFLGDVTGIAPAGGGGILSDVSGAVSNTANTVVDNIEIIIQGGADTAENIANSVYNVFQQTSQDLNSAVEQ